MAKKFEKAGYSAISRVFQRDASIQDKEEEPKAPPAAPKRDKKPEPAAEPPPASVEEASAEDVHPEGPSVEDVVELRPKVKSKSKPARSAAPVPDAGDPEGPVPSGGGEEKPRRSTRAGGRLPAIRVECEPDEFDDYQDMVHKLGRAAGHKLSQNILGRALVRIALELEADIRREAEKNPPRPRPANGNSEEMALHEDEWEQVVREAFRALPNRRSR